MTTKKKELKDYILDTPHFDWLSFTVFGISVYDVCTSLGFDITNLFPLNKSINFYDQCYKIDSTDIILCSKSEDSKAGSCVGDMGVNVIVPASFIGVLFDSMGGDNETLEADIMRKLVDFVHAHDGKFSRLDVCIDVSIAYRSAQFTPYQLFNHREYQVSKFRHITMSGAPEFGCTLYFGKRGSTHTFLRIYDKAKEQGDFENLVTRVEFELKREEAECFLQSYFDNGMASSFRNLVKNKIRFENYEIWSKFEELLDKLADFRNFTQRYRPLYPKKPLDCVRSLCFMFYQYSKSLNFFCHLYGKDVLFNYLLECLDCDEDVFLRISFDDWLSSVQNE